METNDKAATLWLIFVLIIRADSYPPKILFYARFNFNINFVTIQFLRIEIED